MRLEYLHLIKLMGTDSMLEASAGESLNQILRDRQIEQMQRFLDKAKVSYVRSIRTV